MSLNKTQLIGNLCFDPEVRQTASGSTVANLRIATNERQKNKDGTWGDHTEYHRVVTFGKTAENVSRFLKKGRQVYIEGKLRTNKWQDKDGNDRQNTEIVAFTVQFLGGKGASDDGHSGGYVPPANDSAPADDIPF